MTFGERFIENRGKAIEVDGESVVPALRYTVSQDDHVRIIFRRCVSEPVQGICLLLKGGSLEFNGRDFKQPVVWRDTAPDETGLICKTKKPRELLIWNCWRDDRQVMQAWIGNAGMRITKSADQRFTIECNSRPEVTFKDLVFDLIIEPAVSLAPRV